MNQSRNSSSPCPLTPHVSQPARTTPGSQLQLCFSWSGNQNVCCKKVCYHFQLLTEHIWAWILSRVPDLRLGWKQFWGKYLVSVDLKFRGAETNSLLSSWFLSMKLGQRLDQTVSLFLSVLMSLLKRFWKRRVEWESCYHNYVMNISCSFCDVLDSTPSNIWH